MKDLKPYFIREKIIKSIREFFYQQNFHEVIIPILNDTVPIESNLYPFVTEWKTREKKQTYFLPMSPERSLKIKLAQGIGNCFSIGHSFRNLENRGSLHNPEFLMLEWYRENSNYKEIMQDVIKLLRFIKFYINSDINIPDQWPIYSIPDLFKKYAPIDIDKAIKQDIYDKVFVNEIESRLPDSPIFLIDFPSIISPLCQPKKDKPYLAERFEFYINKIELGNGNTENLDYLSIKKNFEKGKEKRKKKKFIDQPIDTDFLSALKAMKESGKSYAGIGVGIDRLAMLFSDVKSIDIIN